MRITRLSLVIAIAVCAMLVVGILASAAPWLAREGLFEFTAREPNNRRPVEPGTPPKGGPAEPLGKSDVGCGPPAVS